LRLTANNFRAAKLLQSGILAAALRFKRLLLAAKFQEEKERRIFSTYRVKRDNRTILLRFPPILEYLSFAKPAAILTPMRYIIH
jgi:hypothetical protein